MFCYLVCKPLSHGFLQACVCINIHDQLRGQCSLLGVVTCCYVSRTSATPTHKYYTIMAAVMETKSQHNYCQQLEH